MTINTNDLRDWADRMARHAAPVTAADREYLHRIASELDATRTERNLARKRAEPPNAPGGT